MRCEFTAASNKNGTPRFVASQLSLRHFLGRTGTYEKAKFVRKMYLTLDKKVASLTGLPYCLPRKRIREVKARRLYPLKVRNWGELTSALTTTGLERPVISSKPPRNAQ